MLPKINLTRQGFRLIVLFIFFYISINIPTHSQPVTTHYYSIKNNSTGQYLAVDNGGNLYLSPNDDPLSTKTWKVVMGDDHHYIANSAYSKDLFLSPTSPLASTTKKALEFKIVLDPIVGDSILPVPIGPDRFMALNDGAFVISSTIDYWTFSLNSPINFPAPTTYVKIEKDSKYLEWNGKDCSFKSNNGFKSQEWQVWPEHDGSVRFTNRNGREELFLTKSSGRLTLESTGSGLQKCKIIQSTDNLITGYIGNNSFNKDAEVFKLVSTSNPVLPYGDVLNSIDHQYKILSSAGVPTMFDAKNYQFVKGPNNSYRIINRTASNRSRETQYLSEVSGIPTDDDIHEKSLWALTYSNSTRSYAIKNISTGAYLHPDTMRNTTYDWHLDIQTAHIHDDSYYMVVTGDPQFYRVMELGHDTTGYILIGNHHNKKKSEKANISQIRSIVQLKNRRSSIDVKGLIINGDLTEKPARSNRKKYELMYKENEDLREITLYPGLGNHDYANHLSKGSEMLIKHHLIKDVMQLPITGFDWNSKDEQGSLAYSWEIGSIHFVQLHNYPTYEVDRSNFYKIRSSLAWLERDLEQAYRRGKSVILNLHDRKMHFKGSERRDFENIISRYDNITAVFAGHLHPQLGRYGSYRDKYRVPIYQSGSPIYGSYLVATFGNGEMRVEKVKHMTVNTSSLYVELLPNRITQDSTIPLR
ncbi:hypothetical protein [Ekhidna sp.]